MQKSVHPEIDIKVLKYGQIARLHKRQGLTQLKLALKCDTDRQNMTRIKTARVNISMVTLARIAFELEMLPKIY